MRDDLYVTSVRLVISDHAGAVDECTVSDLFLWPR